jgi:hypothetical protein
MNACRASWKGILVIGLLAGWSGPAPRDAKDDLLRALQKLAASESFSWVAMTIEESDAKVPQLAETIEGKWARSGWRKLARPKTKSTTEAFMKGDRIALLTAAGWKVIDVAAAPPPGKKADKDVRRAQEFDLVKDPLAEAKILLGRGQDFTGRENGLYTGTVAALDAPLVLERAVTAGNKLPEGAAMRVNFRIKDGLLASYELIATYQSTRGKQKQVVENILSMAVDFAEIGTTAIEVPEEARKVLE